MKQVFGNVLAEYCMQDYTPWHMPGHKRRWAVESVNKDREHGIHVGNRELRETQTCLQEQGSACNVWAGMKSYDVTELPELDDLHEPKNSLLESMKELRCVYGSVASYYLVNGSTCGNLAAISAVCHTGDTIIVGRNCHKSVYHAIAMLELQPVYIVPEIIKDWGMCAGIKASQVEAVLAKYPQAKAVVITSPTYEGIVSDISSISEIVHRYGAYLIVDEAHGAHLEFDAQDILPAVRCGADLIIESLHKTLPCFTQCAILHIGQGTDQTGKILHDRSTLMKRVERYLDVYETSSPSYLFVADMEQVIARMDQWRETEFKSYYKRLKKYRNKWEHLERIHILSSEDIYKSGSNNYKEETGGEYQFASGHAYALDETKLIFAQDDLMGEELREILASKYGQIMEMAAIGYVLAISTVMDSEEAFAKLDQALQELNTLDIHTEEWKEKNWGEVSKGRREKEDGREAPEGRQEKEGVGETPENKQVSEDGREAPESRQEEKVRKDFIDIKKGEGKKESCKLCIEVLKSELGDEECIPGKAWQMNTEVISILQAEGRIAGDFVSVYPPGIPVCVPGERITEKAVQDIIMCYQEGITVQGLLEG